MKPELQEARQAWPEEEDNHEKEESKGNDEKRSQGIGYSQIASNTAKNSAIEKPKSATNADKKDFFFGSNQTKKTEEKSARMKSPKGNIKEEKANPQDSQRHPQFTYYMTKLAVYCKTPPQFNSPKFSPKLSVPTLL